MVPVFVGISGGKLLVLSSLAIDMGVPRVAQVICSTKSKDDVVSYEVGCLN